MTDVRNAGEGFCCSIRFDVVSRDPIRARIPPSDKEQRGPVASVADKPLAGSTTCGDCNDGHRVGGAGERVRWVRASSTEDSLYRGGDQDPLQCCREAERGGKGAVMGLGLPKKRDRQPIYRYRLHGSLLLKNLKK